MTTWRRAVCVVWAAFAMALSGLGPAVAQVPTLDAANQRAAGHPSPRSTFALERRTRRVDSL